MMMKIKERKRKMKKMNQSEKEDDNLVSFKLSTFNRTIKNNKLEPIQFNY